MISGVKTFRISGVPIEISLEVDLKMVAWAQRFIQGIQKYSVYQNHHRYPNLQKSSPLDHAFICEEETPLCATDGEAELPLCKLIEWE